MGSSLDLDLKCNVPCKARESNMIVISSRCEGLADARRSERCRQPLLGGPVKEEPS